MNAETYRIYEGSEEIEAAKARGEQIIELGDGIARALTMTEMVCKVAPDDVERINQAALSNRRFWRMFPVAVAMTSEL